MWLVKLLADLPKELIVLLISATPVIEVRGAIPAALLYFKLPVVIALLLCIFGSLLPVFPLLWVLNNLTEVLRKQPLFDRFFVWLFARTRARSKVIEDLELIGLTLFIAIPLPGTGVWTGTIAAYLLGLRWGPTFLAALLGTIIASLIMTAGSLGIIRLLF